MMNSSKWFIRSSEFQRKKVSLDNPRCRLSGGINYLQWSMNVSSSWSMYWLSYSIRYRSFICVKFGAVSRRALWLTILVAGSKVKDSKSFSKTGGSMLPKVGSHEAARMMHSSIEDLTYLTSTFPLFVLKSPNYSKTFLRVSGSCGLKLVKMANSSMSEHLL